MGLIKPKKLFPGATIGIVAPSSRIEPEFIETSVHSLRGHGFHVVVHPQAYNRDRGSAGTTEEKITALHEMFADKTIDAVLCGRGGNRALHMLDGLDYDLIRSNPKMLMGFSDITTLLSAIYAQTGLVTFHTITMGGYHPDRPQSSAKATLPFIQGDWVHYGWPQDYPMDVIRPGATEGVLYGGNLHLLMALFTAGDAYVPDLTGKILIIEDVGEEIRSIDRMLGALRLRGVFDQIAGLIVGQMTDITDTSTSNILFERTVRDVVMEHTAKIKGPVVLNAPIGHEHPNVPFPLGIKARLTAPSNGVPGLRLLESPFADA